MTTTTLVPERLAQLDAITLDRGPHSFFDEGHCALEIVAWLAGEPHTDDPECVSPVLRRFTFQLNDAWDDADRQKLKPVLPRLVGTADDGHDDARSYLALDWLIRTYAPTWLDLAGLGDHAAALRALDPIVDETTADAAAGAARSARAAARSAQAAARSAAGAFARSAAGAFAGLAARDATGLAVRHAARAAAQTTAGLAVWDAAGLAAETAARAAGGAAELTAGWTAARDALAPTVETLRASALDLLDRMLQAGEGA